MGYRSEVVIALTNDLKDSSPLPAWVEEQSDDIIISKDYTIFVINSIKWYPEVFEDVKAVEDWFSKMDEFNQDDYGAIILGEDFGDVTYHGTPYNFNIYPIQSISIG